MDQQALGDRHPGGNVKSKARKEHPHISIFGNASEAGWWLDWKGRGDREDRGSVLP